MKNLKTKLSLCLASFALMMASSTALVAQVLNAPANVSDASVSSAGVVNSTGLAVLVGFDNGTGVEQAGVLVFKLPTAPAGKAVVNINRLSVNNPWVTQAGTTFNVDLSAIGVRSSPTVLASDFSAPGTMIQEDYLNLGQMPSRSTRSTAHVNASGKANLANYLQSNYTNGHYLFLRLKVEPGTTPQPGNHYNVSLQNHYTAWRQPVLKLVFGTLNQAPTANAGADQSVCADGSTASVTLDGSGSSDPDGNALTYTWKEGAATIATGVNPAVFLNVGAHTIDLTVDDGNGGTDTDQVIITVNASPAVTVADASTCAGGSAMISAGVTSGAAPFSYAWTVPGGATNPGNSTGFSATVAGTYSVVVTDVHGCTGTDSGTLTVNPNPIVTVADASTCAGGSAMISAGVTSGAAPFSYAWTVPGGATNPGNSTGFSATVAGTYSVVVTDMHGCTGSGSGTLTVHPNPTADAGSDASIFAGGETAIGGAPTGSGGSGALSYSWSPTTGLDDASSANPTAELEATTTYTVTVTDANGCESTDEVTVTVQSNSDVIAEACAAVQALIDDPNTNPDALGALQDAKDALIEAETAADEGDIEGMFDALRDAADALEEAREDDVDTDPIASLLADLGRHIAVEKSEEALNCDPNPTGKMADDMEDGDNDLADGDTEAGETYFGDAIKDYKKAWEDYCGALERCDGAEKAAVAEAAAVENVTPQAFALHQNYPNPFNPTTTIQFDLIDAGHVSLNIYNNAGQLVRTLVSGDYAPGAHRVSWDARDNSGARVASGLYLYTIKVGQQFTAQKKLLLMK